MVHLDVKKVGRVPVRTRCRLAQDISRGLAPQGEHAALQDLEERLRAHIEALIPLVEEGKGRSGGFGDVAWESAAVRGRRLLSSRMIDADPSPAPERVVFALAHAARSLLLFAGLR
ncbi:DUF6415 family natural product biosynthesis protein [Streptomyces olivoreticuli]